MPAWGILAAGISATNQLISNQINKKQAKEMAKYQNDIAVDNWHRENRYNSPAAQMQRLKQAGLNPNLIYQSGSAVQPSGSIDQPQVSTPQVDINGGSEFMSGLQYSLQQDSVAQNVETQKAMKDYYDRLADNAHMDYLKKVADSPYFDDNAKYQSITAMHNMNEAATRVDVQKNLASLYEQQTGLTSEQIQMSRVSQDKIRAEIGAIAVHKKLEKAQTEKCYQEIDESFFRIKNILKSMENVDYDIAYKAIQIEMQKMLEHYQGEQLSTQLELMNKQLESLEMDIKRKTVQGPLDCIKTISDIILDFGTLGLRR